MRIILCPWLFLCIAPLFCCVGTLAQDVPFGTGSWDSKSLGNHRAVLSLPIGGDVVHARIPWRRPDAHPEQKRIIAVEAETGQEITNLLALVVNNAYGEVLFQATKPGIYYIYYMPYKTQGTSYPKVSYLPAENLADPAWVARNGLRSETAGSFKPDCPEARVVEFQSIDAFNSFYPMEVIATPEEVAELLSGHSGKPFLLFPEDRSNPIRLADQLPRKWVKEGPKAEFMGETAKGEFYAFQLGLYAVAHDIADVRVRFSSLRGSRHRSIPAAAMRCFNTGGTNWDGKAFGKAVPVGKGKVQPLWCGFQVPPDAVPGRYYGKVMVKPAGMPEQTVQLAITVLDKNIADSGDDEPWRHSRLRWLDSRLAFDDEVIRPFTPIRVAQSTLGILGRQVVLGSRGLPAQVLSFFTPEVTGIGSNSTPVLASPMELVVEDGAGHLVHWNQTPPTVTRETPGLVKWTASSKGASLRMRVDGQLEPDGFVQIQIALRSTRTVDLRDVRLEIPLESAVAKYMMGLGLKGGFRPAGYDWTWDVKKNQDGAWVGDACAGMQFSLRDENYERPLNTNFYQDKPLRMPPSWYNEGRGGITVREVNGMVLISCYGGPRTLKKGEILHFNFNLLLTPFKPLDTEAQWRTRFFHSFQPIDQVLQSGANTINVHHGNDANPYINYPFLHPEQLKTYIDEAHQHGLKVKIYDTIRELSNHAPELFALRSLGHEIFSAGPGGGYSWLQEHLRDDYIPAWFVPQWQDAAIIDSGMSRWHNYYVEGIDWLARNMQIDGLYLDDLAFDRVTMKRVRKVLDRRRTDALIDLHSANQYNPRDGFANSANLYLEHFPYINRLWFGEYFDPGSPPDFWLVEMTGIPYGLMGEMLQDGGNRWRGMLYGMTCRMPYDHNDPSPIWKVWDEFGIQESAMIGYWSPRCPVTTGRQDVLATAYTRKGKTLISLASWSPEDVSVQLTCDWSALGLDPSRAVFRAPQVRNFQEAARFRPGDPIPVAQGKGWLLILEPDSVPPR